MHILRTTKRRYLLLGAVLVAGTLLAVWWFGFHGIHPRLIVWPPPAVIPIPAALDELAEIDVAEIPLADVLTLLGERHGVAIELDSFAQASLGLSGKEPVTCRLSGLRFSSPASRG